MNLGKAVREKRFRKASLHVGSEGEVLADSEKGWLEVGGESLQGIPGLAGQAGPRLTHQRFSLQCALPW